MIVRQDLTEFVDLVHVLVVEELEDGEYILELLARIVGGVSERSVAVVADLVVQI